MTTERKHRLIQLLWRVVTYSTELGVAFLFMVEGLLQMYGVIVLTCFLFAIIYGEMHSGRN